MQKTLIIIVSLILLAGLTWPWLSKIPFRKLPGDIVLEKENFKFYFPIVTMILLSTVASLLFWLFKK